MNFGLIRETGRRKHSRMDSKNIRNRIVYKNRCRNGAGRLKYYQMYHKVSDMLHGEMSAHTILHTFVCPKNMSRGEDHRFSNNTT